MRMLSYPCKHLFAMTILGLCLAGVMITADAQETVQSLAENTSDTDSPSPSNTTTAHPVSTVDANYVIGSDDMLAIDVWHEKELSRVLSVRPDGKISLPLMGEL